MEPIVEIDNVTRSFPLGKVTVQALRGVSLSIERGEFLAIAGPSGSGKTTLLNQIGCVDIPTSGHVKVAGSITSLLSESELTQLRLRSLGFIFQTFNLVSVLNVFQNVELPLLLQGGFTKGERTQKIDQLLDAVGLTDQRRQRPNELSGGQRQRVAIARALITQPSIVLADEPTANLDSATGTRIIELMKLQNKSLGTTFIFSTHDERVMNQARRIILLEDGLISSDKHTDMELG
ncbi:MAG: ABC transporter ATP-binding protein [Bradymonadia bacterium]